MFFKLRRLFYLLFLFSSSSFLFAQIPNAGFENWTNGNPDDWFAFNAPGLWITITQSSESHSGSSAAKLEIVNSGLGPLFPILSSVFPISQNYGSLKGYYKFSPINEDQFFDIAIITYKNSNFLGSGFWGTNVAASSYTQFEVPITSTEIPDSVFIEFIITDTSESGEGIGANAIIDDLSFGGPVEVKDVNEIPIKYSLKQNYPNPFNPSTTIEFSIPEESFIELKVYDVLGREVAELVNENKPVGTYKVNFNASNLTSGIYIAKLTAGDFTQSFKMTLMK
jgi:hypothetical protein